MILTLVRHAKSSWDDPALIDFYRPLSRRGLRDAPSMAAWFGKTGFRPDHWVCSPALRAKQTAEIFAKALARQHRRLMVDDRIYLAGVKDWIEVISSIPHHRQHVIAFGHNPGLQEIVTHLTGTPIVKIPTCAIISLRIKTTPDPFQIRGRLLEFTTPKMLRH